MEQSNLKKLFDDKHLTLGSVESFTGGLFASEITSICGASSFFKGSVVTYATEEKINVVVCHYQKLIKAKNIFQ